MKKGNLRVYIEEKMFINMYQFCEEGCLHNYKSHLINKGIICVHHPIDLLTHPHPIPQLLHTCGTLWVVHQ